MKTKVNICTEEWCNLVFDGKNKTYGAFAIRTHAGEVKIKALFITLSIAVSIAIYPLLTGKTPIEILKPGYSDPVELTNPPLDVPKELTKPASPDAPKPPKASVAFPQPVISITETTGEVPTQTELATSNKPIGLINVEGGLNDPSDPGDGGGTGNSKGNQVFKFVEKMPQFPGGTDELMKFLKKNLRYPEIALENYIQGKVFAQFIVDKTGKIIDLQIIKGLDKSCNEETLRILKLMPDWKPGIQNGMPVSVYFTIPVVFSLGSR